MSEVRVPRKCIYCKVEDTEPKHENILPGFVSVYAHKGCCADVTNCELCGPEVLEGVNQ
jgi:hypothetical protein